MITDLCPEEDVENLFEMPFCALSLASRKWGVDVEGSTTNEVAWASAASGDIRDSLVKSFGHDGIMVQDKSVMNFFVR